MERATPRRLGPPSFGYFRRAGMLRADANEAPIRLRIFELFAEHKRKKTVASILSAEGHTTRSGAHFTGPAIGRLIEDSTVRGIEGVAEAIVPDELWQRCNDILAEQAKTGGAKRTVAHLFAGLATCACGGKMYVPSRSQKYVCGECRKKIPKDDLEAIFHEQLKLYPLLETEDGTEINLHNAWSELPFERKRDLVEELVEDISIDTKKVSMRLVAL